MATLGERIVALEGKIEDLENDITTLIDAKKTRANREWTIIVTVLGLMGSIVAKGMGYL